MVAAWMLYAAAVAALLTVGAAALDRALRAAARPTRLVWAGALLASLAVPASAPWRAPSLASAAPLSGATTANGRVPDREVSIDPARALVWRRLLARAGRWELAVAPPAPRWAALDRPLLAAWSAASAALLAWLALSHRTLRRRRRRWDAASVQGERVLVSPDVGPAVVGVVDPRVVLPAWALALGADRLTLLLAHEREHARARDPLLLTVATVAAALVPWSPAAWWQLRRLRLAVEVDCDRRVLRRHPDARAYGTLLLDVAGRARAAGPASPLVTPALAAPVASLEWRIRMMTSRPPRRAALQTAALAVAATALVVAACRTPRPVIPGAAEREAARRGGTSGEASVALQTIGPVAARQSAAPLGVAPASTVPASAAPASAGRVNGAPANAGPTNAASGSVAPAGGASRAGTPASSASGSVAPERTTPTSDAPARLTVGSAAPDAAPRAAAPPAQPPQESIDDRRLAVVVLGTVKDETNLAVQRELVRALGALIVPAGSPRVIPSADVEVTTTAAGFTTLALPDVRPMGQLLRSGAVLGVTVASDAGQVQLTPVLVYPRDTVAPRRLPSAAGGSATAAADALARQLVTAGAVRAPLRARP